MPSCRPLHSTRAVATPTMGIPTPFPRSRITPCCGTWSKRRPLNTRHTSPGRTILQPASNISFQHPAPSIPPGTTSKPPPPPTSNPLTAPVGTPGSPRPTHDDLHRPLPPQRLARLHPRHDAAPVSLGRATSRSASPPAGSTGRTSRRRGAPAAAPTPGGPTPWASAARRRCSRRSSRRARSPARGPRTTTSTP